MRPRWVHLVIAFQDADLEVQISRSINHKFSGSSSVLAGNEDTLYSRYVHLSLRLHPAHTLKKRMRITKKGNHVLVTLAEN